MCDKPESPIERADRKRAKRFDQADANHDGKLSRNEASDYLVNEVFDSRDANHDGKMTEQEWTGGDPSRAADFKKRDANHDGVVTKQEAMAYGRAHGVVNNIMKEADTNHDGYLERSEVKAYYANREERQISSWNWLRLDFLRKLDFRREWVGRDSNPQPTP